MLLFLDIETTGLDSANGEILEIAAIRFDGEHTQEVFETLITLPEGKEIPEFITTLTGITANMCAQNGVPLAQAQEDWRNFLRPDDVIVGHNISFDTGFLKTKGFAVNNAEIDTFVLSSILLRNEESHSLEVLTEKYDLLHENAHRAKSDVLANIEFWKLLVTLWGTLVKTQNFASLQTKTDAILQKSDIPERLFFTLPTKKFPDMEAVLSRIVRKNTLLPEPETAFTNDLEAVWKNDEPLIFWDTVDAPLRMKEVFSSALAQNKPVFCLYPDANSSEYIAHFHALFPYFPSLSIVLPEGRTVDREKLKTLWDLPSFSRAETIVALKTLLADVEDDLVSLSFRGEEWAVVRSLTQGESHLLSSDTGITFVPFSQVHRIPAESILLVFNAGNIEDDLSNTLQIQRFSKRFQEDAQEIGGSFFADFEAWSRDFGESLRKKLGKNEYPIKTQWDEKFIMSDTEIRKAVKHFEDLSLKFPEAFLKSPFADMIPFFLEGGDSNMLKMIQLFPDNAWALIMIPIDLTPSFSQFIAPAQKIIFLGNAYPKDEKGNIIFSFLPEKKVLHTFPKPLEYFMGQTVKIPYGVKDDQNPKDWKPLLKNLFTCHKKILFSVNSKKTAKIFAESFAPWAAEQGIFIISSESGSPGKIRSFLRKSLANDTPTLLIAPPRTLDDVHPEEFEFTALLILKFAFDPPKDPLLSLRRKSTPNDFDDFAVPRARSRFEAEIYRLYRPHHAVEIFFGDPRLADRNSFGARFAKVFPENITVEKE
ncbi:MAG: 3'-5' exonuclease [Candidatus Peregrinibacteria bacterium]